MSRVTYPWPSSRSISLAVKATQERYSKGNAKGGWFKGKEIDQNQPSPVIDAQVAHTDYTSKRVKASKFRRKADMSNKDDVAMVRKLQADAEKAKSTFKQKQEKAKEQGYKIDSRGKWKNKASTRQVTKQEMTLAKENLALATKADNGDIETLIVIDRSGKIILKKDGSKPNEVGFTLDEEDIVSRAEGVVLTHDHPSGTGFSQADFQAATNLRVTTLVAVGRVGTIEGDPKAYYEYTMKPNGNYPMGEAGATRISNTYVRDIAEMINDGLRNKYQEEFYDQPEYDNLSYLRGKDREALVEKLADRVNINRSNELSTVLADKLGWTYTRELKRID